MDERKGVAMGKSPVAGRGWFAMLTDPQGNPFAIWQMGPNPK
jgi:predicted enzyme related to lactoylglutathione lyase